MLIRQEESPGWKRQYTLKVDRREKADRIVNELPQAVLNNEFIEMDTPKLYKKSIFTFFS